MIIQIKKKVDKLWPCERKRRNTSLVRNLNHHSLSNLSIVLNLSLKGNLHSRRYDQIQRQGKIGTRQKIGAEHRENCDKLKVGLDRYCIGIPILYNKRSRRGRGNSPSKLMKQSTIWPTIRGHHMEIIFNEKQPKEKNGYKTTGIQMFYLQ